MDEKKKLAIITPGFMPVPAVKGGAIEQLIQYFVEGNEVKYQYDIDVYTIDDPLLKDLKYKHSKIIKIKNKQKSNIVYRLLYGIKNRVNRLIKNQKVNSYLIDKVCRKFKKDYYDIVLFENNMDIYEKLYPSLGNEKVIFHLHNDIDCNDLTKTKEKTQFILSTADEVIVVSEFLKNKLCEISPIHKAKIYVGYNGIKKSNFKFNTTEERYKTRKKYGLKKDDVVFTFVGRMCSDKGIDKLLLAMAKLKEYKNIHCLIVGNNFFGTNEENSYITNLKGIAQGLENKIHFTDYVPNDQLYRIYSISDCVVIPAQYEEVFGVVALEAMTMKLPVIASASGGLPEVLSRDCAIFVERNSQFVNNLSNAILKIALNKKLRLTLGMNGEKRSNVFPQNTEEYFNLISEIIKK